MKPQYIALIAATAALPLGAQATAPAAPAAVTAPAADSLLQQRAAAHPALAAIPADAEFVLSIDNIGTAAEGLAKLGLLDASDVELARQPKGISLALSPQFVSQFADLIPLYADFNAMSIQLAKDISAESDTEELESQVEAIQSQITGKLAAAVKKIDKVGPVYAVLSMDSQYNADLAASYDQVLQEFKGSESVEYVEINGLKGFKLTAQIPDSDEELKELAAALNGRSIYILSKLVGDTLVIGLAENPEDIRPAATPAESILATDKLAKGDKALGQRSYLSCYSGANLVNTLMKMNKIGPTLDGLWQAIQATYLKRLKPETAAACARGVEMVMTELKKLDKSQAAKHPAFSHLWQDDSAIHFELEEDACGYSYEPAKSLGSGLDTKDAPFYLEASPMRFPNPINVPNLVRGLSSAAPLIDLVVEGSEEAAERSYQNQQEPVVKEVLDSSLKAFETLGSGICGADLIYVSPEGGFSYASSVKDRNAVVSGFTQLIDVSNILSDGLFKEELVKHSTVKQEGNNTIATLDTDGGRVKWCAVLNDNFLTAGTIAGFSDKLADAANAPEFSGIRFSLNLAALACLKDILPPEAEEVCACAAKYVESISGHNDIKDGISTFTLDIKPAQVEKDTAAPAK